jgi:hypothetical protein
MPRIDSGPAERHWQSATKTPREISPARGDCGGVGQERHAALIYGSSRIAECKNFQCGKMAPKISQKLVRFERVLGELPLPSPRVTRLFAATVLLLRFRGPTGRWFDQA